MRSACLLSLLVLSGGPLFSQSGTTAVSMGQEFAELAAHGGLSGKGFAAFQAYRSDDIRGSQFFLPDWSHGEVVTVRMEVFSKDLEFIYDKVRQELFVRKNDSSLVLLTNKDEIRSFRLKNNEGEQFSFINSKFFTEDRPEVFYQFMVNDSAKLSLLKYINTSLVKADMRDMMKVREGDIYDAWVDKNTYYIVRADGMKATVQLKTKSLKKSFADLGIDIDPYLRDHPQGIIDEDYLVAMVQQLNR
jgi:hypothetical protein